MYPFSSQSSSDSEEELSSELESSLDVVSYLNEKCVYQYAVKIHLFSAKQFDIHKFLSFQGLIHFSCSGEVTFSIKILQLLFTLFKITLLLNLIVQLFQ